MKALKLGSGWRFAIRLLHKSLSGGIMSWKHILLILLCLMAVRVFCQNQMDLMTTLYGEFANDYFGSNLLSMDYNGDGYDDLIVVAQNWSATGVYSEYDSFGKIYFYWGGPTFDNIPDFVIEGQWYHHLSVPTGPMLCDAGDLNGDGRDDLTFTCTFDLNGGGYKSIAVFLGRQNPQSQPDRVVTLPQTFVIPRPLGDINADGKADLAIYGVQYPSNRPFCYLWTDFDSDPVEFRRFGYLGFITLNGIGDVNNDGYSDVFYVYPDNPNVYYEQNSVLFYGNNTGSWTDSLSVSGYITEGVSSAYPLGNINGDAYQDFIGHRDRNNQYIWFGAAALDSIPDLSLSNNSEDYDMGTFAMGDRVYAVYGDINNDGYDDFVCCDPTANDWMGQAGVWLGGQNVNAVVDLVLDPPSNAWWMNFGYSKAIGDFNFDGCSDLAISSPVYHQGQQGVLSGKVFVYAGNTYLADTTVATDDPVAPPSHADDWEMHVFPNPCSAKDSHISMSLSGSGYSRDGNYEYRLFNIRGQLISSAHISSRELAIREVRVNVSGMDRGVYHVLMLQNGKSVKITRFVNI